MVVVLAFCWGEDGECGSAGKSRAYSICVGRGFLNEKGLYL
jgi:hypothetical protein